MITRVQFFLVCLLLCLTTTQSAYALVNSLDWIETQTTIRKRLNFDSFAIEEQLPANQWKKIRPFTVDADELKILMQRFNNSHYFFTSKNIVRFTIQGTGLVYDFNTETEELKRIDQTIHSGYNFGAYQFYRKGILYSVGGEGMWNYNRQITFFDEKTKEWEILRPKNDGPEAMANGFQGYSAVEDAYFTGGGDHKNYLENEQIAIERGFYRFDFATKNWDLLGEINAALPIQEHRISYWNGVHFILLARDRLYIINPKLNEVHMYRDNSLYFEGGGKQYARHDTIFYYHNGEQGPVIAIPVNAFLKKASFVGKLYEKDYSTYYYGALALLVLGFIGWKLVQKNGGKQIRFDQAEIKLLNRLVNEQHKPLSTLELNTLLDCDTKSQESQRRIRFMMIKQINEKLEMHFDIHECIERIPSEDDKRLTNYRLKMGTDKKIKELIK
jgi:hypothetical protein